MRETLIVDFCFPKKQNTETSYLPKNILASSSRLSSVCKIGAEHFRLAKFKASFHHASSNFNSCACHFVLASPLPLLSFYHSCSIPYYILIPFVCSLHLSLVLILILIHSRLYSLYLAFAPMYVAPYTIAIYHTLISLFLFLILCFNFRALSLSFFLSFSHFLAF